MDSRSFDGLTRRVAGALNRRRVLASSAAAGVTALLLRDDEAALAKKKRKVCVCGSASAVTCSTRKLKKKGAKKQLKNPCNYKGACIAGVNPCTPQTRCGNDDECPGSEVCRNSACVPGCKTTADCSNDFICKNGGCVCEANKRLCAGRCVDLTTDPNNCGECGRECDTGTICSNGLTCQPAACLAVTEIENDVRLEDDGGLRLVAAASGPNPPYVYGAVGFAVPENITFADITDISAGFQFISGTCGAGTPRFCVQFSTRDDCVCAQFPAASGCDEASSEGSTGNLIGNDTSGVWMRICADGPTINTYSEALTEYGDEPVSAIFLVADSSHGTQVVVVEPCIKTA